MRGSCFRDHVYDHRRRYGRLDTPSSLCAQLNTVGNFVLFRIVITTAGALPVGHRAFQRACAARTLAQARVSTLMSDEAVDQPARAVRLATERRESDGRFARR